FSALAVPALADRTGDHRPWVAVCVGTTTAMLAALGLVPTAAPSLWGHPPRPPRRAPPPPPPPPPLRHGPAGRLPAGRHRPGPGRRPLRRRRLLPGPVPRTGPARRRPPAPTRACSAPAGGL